MHDLGAEREGGTRPSGHDMNHLNYIIERELARGRRWWEKEENRDALVRRGPWL